MPRMDDHDKRVSEALRFYANDGSGERPAFPFDDLKFTLRVAAETIELRREQMSKLGGRHGTCSS